MKTLKKLLPTTSGSTGTRVGSTFLSDWSQCRHFWYARYLAPFHGGQGCDSKYSPPALWLGGILHTGIEAWLRSGWRDGQFDLDVGHDAILAATEERQSEIAFIDEWEKLRGEAIHVFERYAKWCGPGGHDPEWEQWRLVEAASGEPLIEKEFEIDLECDELFYTSKPDAVVWRLSDGAICALDHKTMSASNAGATIAAKRKSSQLTGEQLALSLVWPDETTGVLVNGIIKNAATSKPPRRLESLDRNEARMALFRNHTIRRLQEIERHVEEYWGLLEKGTPEPIAARLVFDDEPTDQACYPYNRPCQFLSTCIHGGSVVEWHEAEMVARYEKGE